MSRTREPFESEKLQLQELNRRLSQYLVRSKQLEQENATLMNEIASIRHSRTGECENKRMFELRETRRLVDRLCSEKRSAEMEREKLRRELQALRAAHSDEAALNKRINTDAQACERQLQQTVRTNAGLEDRLVQLEHEYTVLEDAHGREVARLRDEARSRAVRAPAHPHPAVTMEEMQHYADDFTESCRDTLDMYRVKVQEMEECIRGEQERLRETRMEKKECASQFSRLREEINKQTHVHMNLEEHLMNMQEHFRTEVHHYQVRIIQMGNCMKELLVFIVVMSCCL